MKNLNELYKIQAGLKSRIGYNGPDKFEKMMLALITEVAEAANDWQGFKYWKKNNKPKETLLEEIVDIMHFVLEAGLDLFAFGLLGELPNEIESSKHSGPSITDQFKRVMLRTLILDNDAINGAINVAEWYIDLFEQYLALCKMLGFTEDQIAAAYLKKVAINHERQDNGY